MKIGEVIQRVQSAYSKGVHSVSTRLSSRHIYSKLKTVRAKILTQEYKKGQAISEFSWQTLPCVELIEAPVHECPCIPPLGCCILRTKFPLPKPLTGRDEDMIRNVTSLDGETIYDRTTWYAKKFTTTGNKYTGNKPDYYIRNGYLYLVSKKYPEVISITGLWEDPIEAATFESYCEDTETTLCYDPREIDFYVEEDLVDTIIELAFPELIDRFNRNIEDQTNNGADNIPQQSK